MQTTFVFSLLFCSWLVDSASLFSTPPIKAIEDIQHVLIRVTALPHLSSSQQKDAKSVVDFVMHTVQEVETAPNMTKEVKAKKVKEAIGRLQGLEHKWVEAAKNMTMKERAIGRLQSEIAEKRQLLAKEEGMLKLAKLKKELIEKKLLLKKLIAKQAGVKPQEEEVKLPDSEVKKIQAVASKVSKGNSKKASKLAEVLKMLHAHEHELMDDMKKVDDAEKSSDDKIAKATKDANATKNAGAEKLQRMLKRIKSKNHRLVKKARAAKAAELADVMAAISGIESGDVKALEKVLIKMQGKMEGLNSRTPGKFIY